MIVGVAIPWHPSLTLVLVVAAAANFFPARAAAAIDPVETLRSE